MKPILSGSWSWPGLSQMRKHSAVVANKSLPAIGTFSSVLGTHYILVGGN